MDGRAFVNLTAAFHQLPTLNHKLNHAAVPESPQSAGVEQNAAMLAEKSCLG
jgi:hypothetical protein